MEWNVFCLLACLQLGLSAAQTPINPPVTAVCGLDGFDLSVLFNNKNAWTFTVPANDNCVLPEGLAEEDIAHCKIHFAICQSLPSLCGTSPSNSSVCQEVTLVNGSTLYYNMGFYDPAMTFLPSTTAEFEGFVGAYSGDTITSGHCNGSLSILYTYTCNAHSRWSSQSGNVDGYLVAVQNTFGCLTTVELTYDGACYIPPTLAPAFCQLDDYEIPFLANVSSWLITADPSTCVGDAASCTILLSFCHPVPPNNGAGCYGSSVCQLSMLDNGNNTSVNMGQFQNSTRFYENDENVDGGFHMDVHNGSNVTGEGGEVLCKLDTRIVLLCNGSAQWDSSTTDITEHARIAYDPENGPCEYTLSIQYSGACLTVPPIVPRGSRTSIVGWIFIGIFAFVVLSYLIVGASVQYFVRKERGVRIIPNYDFWKMFVIYVLEGCKFTLDAITCFKFEGRMPSRKVDYDKI